MNGRRFRRLTGVLLKQRRCPLCGWVGYRFEPYGNAMTRRDDAECPGCGSLERHRAAFLLLRDRMPSGQKVLHVAPEPVMIRWLVSRACEYLNVDLHHPAMRRMDLTSIDLPDCSKTLVWCSHVLEHIADDGKALSEIFRVLQPLGLLVLQVPIRGETTDEDAGVVNERDRLHRFLQEDHVRLYGLDLKARIEAHGFICQVLSTTSLPQADQKRYSVRAPLYRDVFVCRRPA
jgi:SAM-dependent methyltransferase